MAFIFGLLLLYVLNGKLYTPKILINSESTSSASNLPYLQRSQRCFLPAGADGSGIVGGRTAAPHSRPYMALLQIRGRLNCGGALVREDFVLTAAHCRIRM